MKKTLITILTTVLLIAGGLKLWQIVQHARLDLVSMNVVNAPLSEVLEKVGRQTREDIVADRSLGGTVTLNVQRMPLREALGRIADQVGALSRLNLAIADSGADFKQLRESLLNGTNPADSGWTNPLAAPALEAELPPPAHQPPATGEARELAHADTSGPAPGRRMRMMVTSDSGPDGESSPGAESRRATITATGPDGTMRVIDLAPQRILVESPLASKLRPNSGLSASRESADRLAQETGGRWQPIYGLEDLPMPPGMMPPELNQLVWKSGDPGDGPGGSTASGSMEAVARQHRFDRLDRLTPEQRAREAAASPGPGMQFDVDIDVR